MEAYSDQGLLSFCLDSLDYCNGTVVARTILLDLCSLLYPGEKHMSIVSCTNSQSYGSVESPNTSVIVSKEAPIMN